MAFGRTPLQDWMRSALAARGVTSFGDLADRYAQDERRGWRLQVLVSDLTERRLLALPRDAGQLGIDPDDVEVAWAVRASVAVPLLSEPVVHHNPITSQDHWLADGTLLSNFPVSYFDVGEIPRWPTFGVRVVDDCRHERRPVTGGGASAGMVRSTLHAVATMHELLRLSEGDRARTIELSARGTSPLDFDLTPAEIDHQIYDAYRAVERFFETWDFGAYIERYRRRDSVSARAPGPVFGGSPESSRSGDLVLDAGAARTAGLVGAVEGLESRGFVSERVLGASAGAVVGSLMVAGYRAGEIRRIVRHMPMGRSHDRAAGVRSYGSQIGSPVSITRGEGVILGGAIGSHRVGMRDSPTAGEHEPVGLDDKHIAAWVAERPEGDTRPLARGESYALNLRVGAPLPSSLFVGGGTVIPAGDVPEEGLRTTWTVSSEQVELGAVSAGVRVEQRQLGGGFSCRASFDLEIPHVGDSVVVTLAATPRHLPKSRIEIAVVARGEPYRELALDLDVDEGVLEARGEAPVGIVDEDAITPAAHLGVRPPREWQKAPARLAIRIGRDRVAAVVGDVRSGGTIRDFDDDVAWNVTVADVGGLIENVRRSAERLRVTHDAYLNAIDPDDLDARLAGFEPAHDWAAAPCLADVDHRRSWEALGASQELRELAHDGHQLYRRVFPARQPDQPLRGFIDAMLPGDRLDINWTATADGIVPRIPWGLMYINDATEPIDATAFLGLRLRLGYRAYRTPDFVGRALGGPEVAWRAHVLYWGGQADDATAAEAARQRLAWTGRRDVCVPAAGGPDARAEVLAALRRPQPSPTAVLHLFCRSDVGDGNDVTLQFGSTNAADDVLRRFDLPSVALEDRPLVFANACGTSASNPYYLNELERGFFDRGARAFLGTETRVPPVLAGRFARTFLHFFMRKADPTPMAAGEAVAQARLFLWSNYRNIGGLLYAYINQFELYHAEDHEVAALR